MFYDSTHKIEIALRENSQNMAAQIVASTEKRRENYYRIGADFRVITRIT